MPVSLCIKAVLGKTAVERKEAFRVNKSRVQKAVERKRKLVNRKRRIEYRLRQRNWTD
jgi:hypothetical protein